MQNIDRNCSAVVILCLHIQSNVVSFIGVVGIVCRLVEAVNLEAVSNPAQNFIHRIYATVVLYLPAEIGTTRDLHHHNCFMTSIHRESSRE